MKNSKKEIIKKITGSTLKVTAKENMLFPDELNLQGDKTIAEIFNEEKEDHEEEDNQKEE